MLRNIKSANDQECLFIKIQHLKMLLYRNWGIKSWRYQRSNVRLHVCKVCTLPLSYIPEPVFLIWHKKYFTLWIYDQLFSKIYFIHCFTRIIWFSLILNVIKKMYINQWHERHYLNLTRLSSEQAVKSAFYPDRTMNISKTFRLRTFWKVWHQKNKKLRWLQKTTGKINKV